MCFDNVHAGAFDKVKDAFGELKSLVSTVLYWPFHFKFQSLGISLPERSKITVFGQISRYSHFL